MCGIGGLTVAPPGPIKSEWLNTFLQDLEHRGRDDAGWTSWYRGKCRQGRGVEQDLVGEALLIHRRLSILDLTKAGHQPMSTPDGRFWITFNGEIYNYVELRKELQAQGQTFRSRSDTEVLLAAYTQWGTQCLNRLVGMFAFAILDTQTRRLFMARDFFGIKPLYYTFWQEGLAFASEIKPLLELPGVTREANARRLYDYLELGLTDHGAETLFGRIKQLPAAHYMEVLLDNPWSPEPVRYWNVDLDQKADLSFAEAAEQLRDLFLDSIRLHLRSDVPVGAALSGGIDSSSIVTTMRLLNPSLEIHTFSYVADDPTISEEPWIDLVGAAATAKVHKVRPKPEDLVADLDSLIEVQGEPFISTSMYAQRRVFQRAREAGIKVMLDGQGADELLGGYPNYRLSRVVSLLRQGRCGAALRLARSAAPPAPRMALFWRALAKRAPPAVQMGVRRALGRNAAPAWLNAEWFAARGVGVRFPVESSDRDALMHELHRTLTETSLPQLLHYEDRNSMAVSIESRVPFLTPALAGFIFALPEHYIIGEDGLTKAVFRRAMRGIVPDVVLDRRDKLGFPTPERDWLLSLGAWVERVLSSETARQIQALNFDGIRRDWVEILRGTRSFDSRVWRWVNLIQWVNKFSVSID